MGGAKPAKIKVRVIKWATEAFLWFNFLGEISPKSAKICGGRRRIKKYLICAQF
jgi:hypothetical protein